MLACELRCHPLERQSHGPRQVRFARDREQGAPERQVDSGSGQLIKGSSGCRRWLRQIAPEGVHSASRAAPDPLLMDGLNESPTTISVPEIVFAWLSPQYEARFMGMQA